MTTKPITEPVVQKKPPPELTAQEKILVANLTASLTAEIRKIVREELDRPKPLFAKRESHKE